MEFQSFAINTEVDSNDGTECTDDDRPTIDGMLLFLFLLLLLLLILPLPIPPLDALPTLRNYIRTKWQDTWDSFPNNKLYKIFPKIQHIPPLHYSYSRKEQVILNRLLIGHTHITHSYLLN